MIAVRHNFLNSTLKKLYVWFISHTSPLFSISSIDFPLCGAYTHFTNYPKNKHDTLVSYPKAYHKLTKIDSMGYVFIQKAEILPCSVQHATKNAHYQTKNNQENDRYILVVIEDVREVTLNRKHSQCDQNSRTTNPDRWIRKPALQTTH